MNYGHLTELWTLPQMYTLPGRGVLTAERAPEALAGAGVGGQYSSGVTVSGQVYPGYVSRAQPM